MFQWPFMKKNGQLGQGAAYFAQKVNTYFFRNLLKKWCSPAFISRLRVSDYQEKRLIRLTLNDTVVV